MDVYQQIFFTTLSFAFGLLHFFLFLYNKRLISNLYFAIFLLFYALSIFFDFQESIVPYGPEKFVYLRIHRAVLPFSPIFALLFTYSIFQIKIPIQFWLISAGLMVTGGLSVLAPINNFFYIQIVLITVFIEATRVFVISIYNKKDGALVIGFGFTLLFIFSSYDVFMDLNLIQPIHGIVNGYPFGFLGLIISISIYLSHDLAKINKKILAQEIKNKEMELNQLLLKAEDARKSKELEEARKIQLSMLPDCAPDLKGFDICFDMRTATEVGGDYYDYQVSAEGVLTIALGDATGHGLKAGLMVSIIKSLFIAYAPNMAIPDFFQKVTWTIKQMKLSNLFMSMMLVKIQKGNLIASSAGMPPIYIYRIKTKSIEEYIIKGMPLGVTDSFTYQTIETQLNPGDTVLLMSDGYPELFNDRDQILEDFRVKDIFKHIAEKPSNEVVHHLFRAGDEWRNGRSLNDDITFVVCKMKPKMAI